jgi:hypothetical protein
VTSTHVWPAGPSFPSDGAVPKYRGAITRTSRRSWPRDPRRASHDGQIPIRSRHLGSTRGHKSAVHKRSPVFRLTAVTIPEGGFISGKPTRSSADRPSGRAGSRTRRHSCPRLAPPARGRDRAHRMTRWDVHSIFEYQSSELLRLGLCANLRPVPPPFTDRFGSRMDGAERQKKVADPTIGKLTRLNRAAPFHTCGRRVCGGRLGSCLQAPGPFAQPCTAGDLCTRARVYVPRPVARPGPGNALDPSSRCAKGGLRHSSRLEV